MKIKTSAILSLEAPKTLKKVRSFLGSLHYICKFIPSLAQISHPLRPLLQKSAKLVGTKIDENCFHETKTRIGNATQNCHYNAQLQNQSDMTLHGPVLVLL